MNIHHYTQTLRLHLLDMARVTQRGIDYSIKACTFDNPELCANVRDDVYEINILHREITGITQELLQTGIPHEADLSRVLSSGRICDALQTVHSHAVEMASNCTRRLEYGRTPRCTDLAAMGDIVNRLMRLCVVALFEEDIEYAKSILRSDGVERLFATTFFGWYSAIDQEERTRASYELAITKHLSQIASQMHEIADAIVFWLKDADRESLPKESKRQLIHSEATTLAIESREVTIVSNGMQSFLQEVDACFADACFWKGSTKNLNSFKSEVRSKSNPHTRTSGV